MDEPWNQSGRTGSSLALLRNICPLRVVGNGRSRGTEGGFVLLVKESAKLGTAPGEAWVKEKPGRRVESLGAVSAAPRMVTVDLEAMSSMDPAVAATYKVAANDATPSTAPVASPAGGPPDPAQEMVVFV